MNTVRRVAKNTSVIVAGDVIFRIISLFIIIYLARYLGTVGFGKYSFVFAYLAFFGVITDFGLHAIIVREMSRDESLAPKLIGNAYIIKLILTVFAVVLSMIVISLMSYPTDTTSYIYIAAFTVFFISFSNFYAAIFQANLRMEYNIFAKLTFKILSAILIFWIIFSRGTLMQVMIVLVFAEIVKTLISYSFSRKFVKPRFSIDFGLWKYLLKEALPIAIYSAIGMIHFRIDVVMLSMMQGNAPVGIYSAAYTLAESLSFIPSALMVSLFPIMAASFKSSKERLIRICRLGIKYILIIMLPIGMGITLLSDKIIFLIYGAEFANSATALQIVIWAIVFIWINAIFVDLLVTMGKQKLNTVSITLCVVINVILNFILIPTLSYNGAAIATVVTSAIFFIASFYFVSKHFQVFPVHKVMVKPVFCGLMMCAFVYYFIDINIFLLVPLAAVVYLMALLVLKTFSKEDFDMFKAMIKR